MLLRRLLAVLVAVGLVLAAGLVRARLERDAPDQPALDELRIVCLDELAAVCEELGAVGVAPVTEAATTTVDRFAQRDPGVDVWVTFEPWSTMAADARRRAQLPELGSTPSAVLATSPVLLAARSDRLAALEGACDGAQLTWRCIGDRAGAPWSQLDAPAAWGDVDVAFNRPADTAEGLLTLAQLAAAFLDGAPVTPQAVATPEFFAWLADLGRSASQVAGQAPLERMLLTGGADVEFTGVVEGAALPLLDDAPASQERIELRELSPTIDAQVRVIGYGTSGQAAMSTIATQLLDPLAVTGWRPADAASSPSGAPTSSASQRQAGVGTPSAAALEALRQTWIEVSRG